MSQVQQSKLNLPLMILAFLTIGGYVWGLSTAAEPTGFALADAGVEAALVDADQLIGSPAAFEDELVELTSVQVQTLLGAHVFIFGDEEVDEEEDEEPGRFLVRLDPDVIAAGVQVLPGDELRLVGNVRAMSDSILEIWDAEAIFVGDEDREIASEFPHFLHATEADVLDSADEVEEEDDETEED